jgi:hypothetical protein
LGILSAFSSLGSPTRSSSSTRSSWVSITSRPFSNSLSNYSWVSWSSSSCSPWDDCSSFMGHRDAIFDVRDIPCLVLRDARNKVV